MRPIDKKLLKASIKGRKNSVKELIKAGANINARDNDKWNSLLLASIQGHVDVVRVLLEAGADVNARDKNGNTSLHLSAVNNHKEVTRVLLKSGINVDAQNDNGRTALLDAVYYGLSTNELEKAYANPFIKDNYGYNVLDMTENDFFDYAEKYIKKHLDSIINAKNNYKDVVLLFAIKNENLNIVIDLLNTFYLFPFDINIQDKYGQTPLMIATWEGYIDIVKLLINCGANPFLKNKHKKTALDIVNDQIEWVNNDDDYIENLKIVRRILEEYMKVYSIIPLIQEAQLKNKRGITKTTLPIELLIKTKTFLFSRHKSKKKSKNKNKKH
jgi:ankyrin repeat protein